jgi:cobalt-zinc-cadmium resistance protein CzcA
MGFVSVFGIAVQYGMLMVSQFQVNLNAGLGPREAALEASRVRTRPILMTTLVALFGLLPAALSHGIGSETQKPLAVVVIGGALLLVTVARFFLVGLLAVLWRNHTPGTPTTIAPPPNDQGNHDTQTVPHPA